ncbi:sugar phosphate isomerase/epimerase [Conexibacter sp. CPCC 206217]|uniref:sugar phosphate isomerase/epimerase family protein n=1 Tax=Conexibacter sp. CPCC 206217 TaxID=3064574 RepID=UPI00271DA630|nr:sugar phosphate isomerase/epimerase family protein [Conexibacter sp. CPCC 206217]MDO8213147.1 sugar phosphate isomerase/epimerase family protein [Conexibacter sp. CPCC 206217]
MDDVELMALYWTVSGPVDVHYGREWSTFEWSARCEQAAKVGFAGIGLWHADIEHQLETRTLQEIKRTFDDAGLKHLQLEFIDDFFVEQGSAARRASDRRRKQLLDAAAVLAPLHVKVGNIPGTAAELGRVIESFNELCAEAAQHGVDIVYEPMPFDVNVNTLDAMVAFAEGIDADNGGVAIDVWHMSKMAIAPAALRALPADRLTWVELSDGLFADRDDRIDETINHRRLPGEGEFDNPGYVAACAEIGYAGPWGVEVLSAELRALPIEQEFQRAYESTRAQFGAAVA